MNYETTNPQGKRVEASFWKFMIVLWHEIMFNRGPRKPHWSAEMYASQFHMDADTAAKWIVALKQSRLFRIRRVPPRYPHKEPATVFEYNTQCTETDWLGFYRGLMAAYAETRGRKFPNLRTWGDIVRHHVEAETEDMIATEGGVRAPILA